jgi:ribonucleoside-diphosphate reductase alpha chain
MSSTSTSSTEHANPFGQEEMYVTKRNGKTEIISFDKILRRLRRLGVDANLKINYTTLAMKVIDQLYDKIPSTKIDELSADQCASLASSHPDYNTLAGRIVISNHHRSTSPSFTKAMKQLYEFKDAQGVNHPMISKELYQIVCSKGKELDAICKYERDYLIDYFGFKTLERAYLIKIARVTVERPQHMWLRVSIGIHGSNMDAVKETYEAMSQKYFTHATPTLFNAGTPRPQLSSCFLLSVESDSINGIFNTLKDCANISKWAGGIGLHIHNIRAMGSHIRGTNGSSNGIVPMLRVFNNTAKYVDQCVTGDTKVFTENGYKSICDIKVGEVVYTRSIPEPADFSKSDFYRTNDTRGLESEDSISIGTNFYRQERGIVKNVVVHDEKEVELLVICSVPVVPKSALNPPDEEEQYLRITAGHPVFSIRKENISDVRSRGEWIEAGNLQVGDRLMFGVAKSVYRTITSISTQKCNESLYDLEIDTSNGSSPNYLTTTALLHNGGGKRNGSFAIYLEPWHADVEMFLQMRKNHGDEELKARDLFYALWIPDLFMKRVKEGGQWTLMCPDECPGLADCCGDAFVELYTKYEREGRGKKTMTARDLWFQVLDAQMETGTPYILYKDACNLKSNQKNLGTIKSSNLCVAPETTVLTDQGHIPIKELSGKNVNVWNGEEWSNVLVQQTGSDQELIEVKTSDGVSLNCTKYHKFYVQPSYNSKPIMKNAIELRPGEKLIKCKYPVIKDGIEIMQFAYTHGFFCGDGTYSTCKDKDPIRCEFSCHEKSFFCKRHKGYDDESKFTDNTKCNALSYLKKPIIRLYGEKVNLLEHIEHRTAKEWNGIINLTLPVNIRDKYYVPVNCDLKTRLDWFAGLCDSDGCISRNGDDQQLQIASIHNEFLKDVKLMLQTCGVNAKITLMHNERQTLMPDGKGGKSLYTSKTINRLLVASCDLQHLVSIGLSCKRLIINSHNPQRNASTFVKIEDVIYSGRRDDTYCFTEPKRHMGVFNGILTGQCTEIVEYSSPDESAVCNLASIGLPMFVNQETREFDLDHLHAITKIVTRNLNRIIDVNFYPTEKTKLSNMRHRPIGIGVQGLADVFIQMGLPFYSDRAKELNISIFETIYHAAVEQSIELAKVEGPYETFVGSPASKGELQFDMWSVKPSNKYDWDNLRKELQTHGMRNSLLVAPMPTASTSQILGFNECIEPITSNIYSRRTMAGEFILANKYLMNDMIQLNLWNEQVKNSIIANNGSIQHIEVIPQKIRDKYKTVWEIPMRSLIDMAADRGAFICQSQSLNLWLEDPNYNTLTSMHFYSWSKGLKTGIYYLRRRAKHQAQQFTIEPEKQNNANATEDEHDICEYCSA